MPTLSLKPTLSPVSLHQKPTTVLSRLKKRVTDISLTKITQTLNYPPHLGLPLAQGQLDACVGCSFTQWLNTSSVYQNNLTLTDAINLWNWCKVHEGKTDADNVGVWPDDAYIRLKNEKLIVSYPDYDIEYEKHLRKQILNVGPVVLSTPWYESFNTPVDGTATRGRLQLFGDIVGGHALLIYWYDTVTNCYWAQQSWVGYAPYDKYNQIVEIPRAIVKHLMLYGGFALNPVKAKKV